MPSTERHRPRQGSPRKRREKPWFAPFTGRAGKLIRLKDYTHILVIGGTGSGKGIGIIVPNLIDRQGPMVVFDTKGDLALIAKKRRKGRVISLAPFSGGDCFNPLDTISGGRA